MACGTSSALCSALATCCLGQDFIDGMSAVPNEIRRNSQLMRTLDKDAYNLSG